MCGLVGVAGHLEFKDEFTMKRLLLADYFRGTDSTGMAAIRTNGAAVVAKLASNPIDLFDSTKFKSVLNGNASRAFIGHNRAATMGLVTTANAHPFQIDHITGAHNGTLCLRSINALQDELGEKFSVDSELLFAAIAKLGVKRAIELCYEGKDSNTGAWAIVWHDENEGTLNFLRNKHRPLFMTWEKNFHRLFWASEWWMIREALESSAKGYEIYTKAGERKGQRVGYFSFEADVHYKFDLEELASSAADKKQPKPKTKKIAGKAWDADKPKEKGNSDGNFTHLNSMGFQFPNQRRESGTHGGNATKTKSRGMSDKKKLITLVGDQTHPYANIVDEDKFCYIGASGCAWCTAPVHFGDPGVTIYERDGRLLCKTCSGYAVDAENPPSRIYLRPVEHDKLQ